MGAVDPWIPIEAHNDFFSLGFWTCDVLDKPLGFFWMRRFLKNDEEHRLAGHARLRENHPGLGIQLALVHEGEEHVYPDRTHPDLPPVQGIQGPNVASCDGYIFVELPQIFKRLLPCG